MSEAKGYNNNPASQLYRPDDIVREAVYLRGLRTGEVMTNLAGTIIVQTGWRRQIQVQLAPHDLNQHSIQMVKLAPSGPKPFRTKDKAKIQEVVASLIITDTIQDSLSDFIRWN